MPNSIERDVYVLRDALKNPISYVRGTDLLPIILHFRDFTIPSGATAKVFVAKNDGNAVYGSATISGNDVTVDVTQQMFITLGVNLMQVEIDSGNETLVTFEQPVMVTPNLKAGDLPDSTTDVDFIDKIIEQAQEAVNDANAALETANTAISGANTAAESANSAAQNANNAAEELQDKVDAGDFTASVQVGTTTTLEPGQDATVSNGGTSKDAVLNFGIPKGDPGVAATIQVGTTQTVQPEADAEVTNTGTTTAAVLNFKIPRGEDGMTDLTAEYKDASEYTCQPTVNAPVVLKKISGKTEQGADPSPDSLQVIKGVGGMGYFDGEWVQGNISSTGTIGTETTGITSANAILCKQNDNIDVTYEDSIDAIAVAFYNASGAYISTSTSGNSVDTFTATAPANAASFKVNLRVVSESTITPSTAKYCTVTINGEYQTGVETQGRNLFDGVWQRGGYRASDGSYDASSHLISNKNVIYANHNDNITVLYKGVNTSIIALFYDKNNSYISYQIISGQEVLNTIAPENTYYFRIDIQLNSGISVDSAKDCSVYINIPELVDYIPYHHTTLTIPLTSPLYDGDKICYVKPGESYIDADGTTVVADRILYGVYRENAVVVFDGSEDETWEIYASEQYSGFRIEIEDMKENSYNDGFSNLFPVQKSSINDPGIWLGSTSSSAYSNYMYVHNVNPTYATDVNNWKTWLQSHNMTVLYPIATPYFEPFQDQSIFYDLRTDDTLSYVYSSDPIEPVLTVEVAKNSTGGYLLESYATAQKNAISEANSQSRISAIEQQLVNQATAPTE